MVRTQRAVQTKVKCITNSAFSPNTHCFPNRHTLYEQVFGQLKDLGIERTNRFCSPRLSPQKIIAFTFRGMYDFEFGFCKNKNH